MRFLKFLFCFLWLPISWAHQSGQLVQDPGFLKVEDIIFDLQESSHQELQGLNIRLFQINNPAYFFVSNFTVGRALLGREQYRIGVNPLIFDSQISDDALKGILAHELVHTEDYYGSTTIGTLIPIGIKVSLPKSRVQYERKTDLKTILKGFAEELIAYKDFQYPLLNPEQLRKKKREYLTPEEINIIKNLSPDILKEWIRNDAPLDLKDIELYLEFRARYPVYERPRMRSGSEYQLDITGGSGEFKVTPVTCSGALKFNKAKNVSSGTHSFRINRRVCAFLISTSEVILLHEVEK